jgi:hypothetical protein
MNTLPLGEAVPLAAAAGLVCRVMTGLAQHRHSIRVAVDTIDADPDIAVSVDRAPEEFLACREQSGPERWDYMLYRAEYRDRFFLRIESSTGPVDIPMLPATASVATVYGWTDDTALVTEARVDEALFRSTVASLRVSESVPRRT